MNDTIKTYLISAAYTFASTFFTVLGTSILAVGHLDWSSATVGALLLAAVRAAFKASLDGFVPKELGGRK